MEINVDYRSIPWAPDYKVGSDGSVWSKVRSPDGEYKKLKGSTNACGYKQIKIWHNESYKYKMVHVLVLELFVGPKPPGMETRHLDGSRSNNKLSNLAWGTKSENVADKERHGTQSRGSKHHSSKYDEHYVKILKKLAFVGVPASIISYVLEMNPVTVSSILCGGSWGQVEIESRSEFENVLVSRRSLGKEWLCQ